ncbi:MAG: thioredoxin domain-containing protein [Verrucomicrobiales bacterium]|nr:thioredoxin domain-containing protein [Verrucomicrobiales bacterium]
MSPPPSAPESHADGHVNRLAREKSPYLLQHRHNPVDWYPWGDEAFAKARAENKPIFLSIGYSTCHWCHVMERESFENKDTADVLNQHFVSIKVDREERPDVDKIYMTYVQARTGGGGWPLNVFLTPDLKPFYGGTYWPPESRHGRPAFGDLLRQIAGVWAERRTEVLDSAAEMTERLRLHTEQTAPATDSPLSAAVMLHAAEQMKEEYDPRHGGFGGAPKFPRPSQPAFLLRHARRTADADAIRMVLHTCERMAAGGMYDQLGGGFARYSVDAEWLVPHFEKMLYDNAQLMHLYLDAHLLDGTGRFANVVRETLTYVLRDMTHPEGGFYSAEDADSEGQEGKFYCWTLAELRSLLSPEELPVVVRRFGITERGNFEDHSNPAPLKNQNVLALVDTNLSPADAVLLDSAKRRLFETRARRVRPHLDDKVLASWNGLMLGAVARASIVLDEPAWLVAAERNVAFLRARLWSEPSGSKPGRLHHRWRDGERDTAHLLDDYAFLLDGVLHLYEATLEPRHLEFAVGLADAMLATFQDTEHGGFWQSASESKDLILRVKEDYDGAEPSGNSIAAHALLRLGAITERSDYRTAAERTLRLFGERMMRLPQAVPALLQALDFSLQEPKRVVVADVGKSATRQVLLRAAHGVYQPNRVILGTTGAVEPFARTLRPKEGRATAYVCTGTACQPPTHDPARLADLLR